MSANTRIEWADHTFNPWEGCQKVGPGCDHCYAEARNARFAGGTAFNWGPGAPRRRTSATNWAKPHTWNRQADKFFAEHGRRQRVFCASLADVFDNAVPAVWRQQLMTLVADTPNLDWLFLTKRIGNVARMLSDDSMHDGRLLTANDMYRPPANLWIGATIVNQEEADRDIPKLLAVPAAKRFLSMEPLLGDVRLGSWLQLSPSAAFLAGKVSSNMPEWTRIGSTAIDWVIVGGESGPGARPMHPEWALSLRDQCAAAGVPFLFKQWGEWMPLSEMAPSLSDALYKSNRKAGEGESQFDIDEIFGRTCTAPMGVLQLDGQVCQLLDPDVFKHGAMSIYKIGKKAAGRRLGDREWNEVPA